MTDAPERIKAWVTRNGVTEWEAGSLQFPPDTEVEYIRADLARPKVKPLEWEDHPPTDGPVISKAVTIIGTYFICDDVDDFSGLYLELISHDNARWWQHVRSTGETILECVHDDNLTFIKAAAQADYERRILSALQGEGETTLDRMITEAVSTYKWHTRDTPPKQDEGEILLAFQCWGSPGHPTKPSQFIRWEFEAIEAQSFNSPHELECGWPATEATHWSRICPPDAIRARGEGRDDG